MSVIRSAMIALALVAASPAGFTQTPASKTQSALPAVKGVDGRWEGKLVIGQAALTVVFRFHTDAAGTSALLDSPDQGASDIPVTALTREGDQVSVTIGDIGATFKGKLGADGKTMSGSWSQLGQTTPIDLAQKAAAVASRPVIQGLDGQWTGEIETGAGGLAIVITVTTDKAGTSATMQAPQQSAAHVPVTSLTREGAKVTMTFAAFGAAWEGDLSADGKSMAGLWRQSGNAMPLELVRQP